MTQRMLNEGLLVCDKRMDEVMLICNTFCSSFGYYDLENKVEWHKNQDNVIKFMTQMYNCSQLTPHMMQWFAAAAMF